jgi:acyl-CoA thioesterase
VRIAKEIVQVLDLESSGDDRYVGRNLTATHGVVFGGQLLAQAVGAAARTVPEMRVKSMHTVFARGASPESSLDLCVERLHAGRSFATVEVSIRQAERLCTRSLVLLDRSDYDLIVHADPAPVVAAPELCPPRPSAVNRGWEVRIVDSVDITDPEAVGPAELYVWSRFEGVGSEDWMSQALLAYASDGFLVGTAMRPHAGVGQALAHVSISTSVITHTLTFHTAFDAADWLLLAQRSPNACHGRSFGRADVFTSDGRMVASYTQENMIRAFAPDRRPRQGERSKY